MKTYDNCPQCGAEIKDEGNSLHIVHIEYECGSKLYWAIGDKEPSLKEYKCNKP